eukprot:1315106-Amphidinium_carterae.2
MDEQYNIPDALRERHAHDREIRRDQGSEMRFKGTKEELEEMRNSLLAFTVAGRRQRLQERERTRPQPKAAPQGVRLPRPMINEMTIEQLREVIQPQEELLERHRAGGGFYVGPPPIPQLDQYKARLDMLETQRQEEQDRLEHHRQ